MKRPAAAINSFWLAAAGVRDPLTSRTSMGSRKKKKTSYNNNPRFPKINVIKDRKIRESGDNIKH